MRVGIVGANSEKFSEQSQVWARRRILEIFKRDTPTLVMSGRYPNGGVPDWAIEEAELQGMPTLSILLPDKPSWGQFMSCGKQIAEGTDKVVCIVVRRFPPTNKKKIGKPRCQHCANAQQPADHVQSVGCWAMHYARSLGKAYQLILIGN